jgi:hypothetical protein
MTQKKRFFWSALEHNHIVFLEAFLKCVDSSFDPKGPNDKFLYNFNHGSIYLSDQLLDVLWKWNGKVFFSTFLERLNTYDDTEKLIERIEKYLSLRHL